MSTYHGTKDANGDPLFSSGRYYLRVRNSIPTHYVTNGVRKIVYCGDCAVEQMDMICTDYVAELIADSETEPMCHDTEI